MGTLDALRIPEQSAWPLELAPWRDSALRRIAQDLASEQSALGVSSPLDSGLRGDVLDAPSLVIEDHSRIRLFERSGDEAYSYRALLLAGDDDLVALGVDRSPGFESYCRDWLGLGAPRMLVPAASERGIGLAERCRLDRDFVHAVARHAENHGGLNLVPYMSTWPLWQLAAAVAGHCRAPLRIIGPPPALTTQVNDKVWFARLAHAALGQAATPPGYSCESASALCRRCLELAPRYRNLAIRLPDSASSAGNLVLDAEPLRDLAPAELRDRLHDRLLRLGWNGRFPLQLVAWESPVLCSPSAQLWIPLPTSGSPRVEALFEQHSSGRAREFDGARPCRLDDAWQRRIALQAFELGRVLQHLGYFGCCSLDAILVGEAPDSAVLHWVECNGRWGGVSLPLSLSRRLSGRAHDAASIAIIEEAHQRLPRRKMEVVLERLGPLLYRRGERARGAVLLSPGRLLAGTGFELMVANPDIERAIETGNEAAEILRRG